MATVDVRSKVEGVAERLCLTLHAHGGLVVMLGPSGTFVVIDEARDRTLKDAVIPRAYLDLVSRTKQPFTRESDPVAVAPVLVDDEVWGMVGVRRERPIPFSEREVEGLEAMAVQVADVVEGRPPPSALRRDTIMDVFGSEPTSVAWAEDEATEAEGGDPITLAFGELEPTPFISVDGLRDLLGNTTRKLLETTGGHVAAIALGREEFRVVAVAANADAPDLPADRLVSRTIVAQVLETGLPVLTFDARRDGDAPPAASVARLSVSTVMCMPLCEDDRTIGAIYSATFNLSGRFDHATLQTLMTDANKLAPMLRGLGQI